jgi:hypothetical protein
MGREASSEPRRPQAYGRQGPCRWRSKGQRAEPPRELTPGNKVPSLESQPRFRIWLWTGTLGNPSRGLKTVGPEPRLLKPLASSRAKAQLDPWAPGLVALREKKTPAQVPEPENPPSSGHGTLLADSLRT